MRDETDNESVEAQVALFLAAWFQVRQQVMELNFKRAHQQGLSATQFMALVVIEEAKEATIGALAERLNLDPATVVRTVDTLERRGAVTRRRDQRDRRLVYVALTDTGREIQRASRQQFESGLAAIFAAMRPEDRTALVTGLEAFAQAAPPSERGRMREEKQDA